MPEIADAQWNFVKVLHFIGPKLVVALFCGSLIGVERELKAKAAGLKTNMLICVGAALFTALSGMAATSLIDKGFVGDPARLAAQIVSGIGFLGGGAIIQSRGTVHGLTTAATIWVVAAIGVAVGMGFLGLGVFAAALVVFVLVTTSMFEDFVLGHSNYFMVQILANDPRAHVRKRVHELLDEHDLTLDDFDLGLKNKMSQIKLRYRGYDKDHKNFLLDLWGIEGVEEVKRK